MLDTLAKVLVTITFELVAIPSNLSSELIYFGKTLGYLTFVRSIDMPSEQSANVA